VTDASTNLLAINRYDEYGRTQTSGTNFGRFLYTGQRYFSAHAMYYYKNRFYNPSGGRFMQTDPIGYGGGLNLYGYVGADPVNFSDPMGLAPMDHCTGTRLCSNHDGSGGGGSVQVFGDIGGYRGAERASPGSLAHEAAHAAAQRGESNSNSGPGWYATLTTYSNGSITVSEPFWKGGTDPFGSAQFFLAGASNAGQNFDEYVPYARLPAGAKRILHDRVVLPGGKVVVMLNLRLFHVRVTDNGRGLFFYIPGGDRSSVRVQSPTNLYPQGYVRYMNSGGNYISPYSGRPGSNDQTHYPLTGFFMTPRYVPR
jgi:RHS repeat-associated protein